jgi:hypothetical protein
VRCQPLKTPQVDYQTVLGSSEGWTTGLLMARGRASSLKHPRKLLPIMWLILVRGLYEELPGGILDSV